MKGNQGKSKEAKREKKIVKVDGRQVKKNWGEEETKERERKKKW